MGKEYFCIDSHKYIFKPPIDPAVYALLLTPGSDEGGDRT